MNPDQVLAALDERVQPDGQLKPAGATEENTDGHAVPVNK